MSDLIDRQAAMIAVTAGSISTATVFGRTEEGMTAAKEIIRAIKSIPSAQPELIRCKDCKHWYSDADAGMACDYTNMAQPEDGFCNWAERKTNAAD